MARPEEVVEIDSREKILDAAERLFARRGYSGIGLSEIAEQVGLGKSSLFHHFRNKQQLYAAVVMRILTAIEGELTRALAAGGTPAERFDRWVDTLIDLLGQHPGYARLLLRSLFEDDDFDGEPEIERHVNAVLARIIDTVTTLLREGMSRGELRAASTRHTLQSLVGLIVYHFASGDFGNQLFGRSLFDPAEVRRRRDEVKALLHHGLGVPRAPRKEEA
jgi:AcrR family transcriptional regulator